MERCFKLEFPLELSDNEHFRPHHQTAQSEDLIKLSSFPDDLLYKQLPLLFPQSCRLNTYVQATEANEGYIFHPAYFTLIYWQW